MTSTALLQSSIPGVPVRRGKVRDIYDFGERLLFVATDRISAFDWVLPNGIPGQGPRADAAERDVVRPARRAEPLLSA
jgi:phosphoribosylaminoimidazole-succinocarboxamide synthase